MLRVELARRSCHAYRLRQSGCPAWSAGVGCPRGALCCPPPGRLPCCPGAARGLSEGSCPAPGASIVKPLDGVKILDLTRVLAGPFATMNLGDLGAEVIKVEKPGVGDDTRSWGPPFVGTESAYFLSVNRNKKSIAVNMKNPKGAKIIKQLAALCDVFVENYVPGKLTAMGLGYEDINKIAPQIVYCSITGYGQTGPKCQQAGYDSIAAAVSGLLHITGTEGGEPVRPGVAMTDLATGLYAYGAIMAALIQRQKTGKGMHLDCSLMASQVACLSHIASNFLNCQIEAQRWGTGHASIVPYQAFKTKDGYIVVGAGNDQQFATVCKILNLSKISHDPRYKNNQQRVLNRKELIGILSARFLEEETTKWLELFEGSGVPYGPINSMKQVFTDPQKDLVAELLHSKNCGQQMILHLLNVTLLTETGKHMSTRSSK
uniref:Succinyl-CoA:glutarate CoA-transferase isoform X2 n=1 Tax=Pogona vitticeps TaxID=103695 RepID=A0ABM5GQB4_9SAUR